MRQGDEVYYLHGDHLGSTSLTTDENGEVVSEVRYHPYGEERWANGESVTDFGFTSQRNEAGFGLMDYNARYYSPVLGRFISPDTIVPEPGSSGGFNRYMYVSGNPLKYTDPSGHCPVCVLPRIAMAAVENVVMMATGRTQDATVTSIGIQGGARAMGLGPVGHNSLDLVSNEEGQIQLFLTVSEGHYVKGMLMGDEEIQKITDINGYMSQHNGILPQEDSFMTHQFDIGVSKGHANGGDIGTFVNRYGGNAMILTGEAGMFEGVSADGTISWNMEGGTPGDVQVNTTGVSVGAPLWPLPVGGAYYVVESQPLLAPFTEEPLELPDALIPVCQAAGQCGN